MIKQRLPIGMLMTLGLGFGLNACTASKVDQCNQVAEVSSQAQGFKAEYDTQIDNFTRQAAEVQSLADMQAAASQYVGTLDTVVKNIDSMVGRLNALELSDSQLAQYRDDYAQIINGYMAELQVASQAMGLVVNVKSEAELKTVLEKFQQQANDAFAKIQTLSTDETVLVDKINSYCGAQAE